MITWRKSSFSAGNGSNCIEVAWRKSTFSGGNGSACLEMAPTPQAILVRDTKNRPGPTLTLPPTAWQALTTTLRP